MDEDEIPALDEINDRIRYLFITREMSDCVFKFQNGEKIEGHKNILGVASPVFRAMLFGDLKATTGTVEIEDISPEIFLKMMEFIYTDSVELDTVETACSVYSVGDKYILPRLQKFCEDYLLLHVNVSSIFFLLDFLKVYENNSIKNECLSFVRSETKSFLGNENFTDIDSHILKTLVKQPALNIDSELDLFKAVEKWVINKSEEEGVSVSEICSSIPSIKNKIRFLSMKGEDFANGPGLSDFLTSEEKVLLSLNLHCNDVSSIPESLCSLRKPRSRRVKYKFSFEKANECTATGLHSPEFQVNYTFWKLNIMRKVINEKCHRILFNISYVRNSVYPTEPCDATVDLRIISHKKNYQPLKICFKKKFNLAENNWCNPLFIEWPFFGIKDHPFIKNNIISVEASVEPDPEPEDD